jgi:3-hydroxyacyl-CoA dehydrogenase/enoyl-CoA hydratase/3-hydroxybutyryl-CoA epimerase
MLFAEAIESVKCLDEGVIESVADANIGSIMGIGFPALTGGTAQFMTGYEGRTGKGLQGFVARARELAATYGERFEPTPWLVDLAEKNGSFPA